MLKLYNLLKTPKAQGHKPLNIKNFFHSLRKTNGRFQDFQERRLHDVVRWGGEALLRLLNVQTWHQVRARAPRSAEAQVRAWRAVVWTGFRLLQRSVSAFSLSWELQARFICKLNAAPLSSAPLNNFLALHLLDAKNVTTQFREY